MLDNKYAAELQALKPWDEVQQIVPIGRGYDKIITAGHGYLIVPKGDIFAAKAAAVCQFGFIGQLAYYLEEDSEAPAFKKAIGS